MSDVNEIICTEDPAEGIGVQFLKDMKQASSRSMHLNRSERLDFLKLSGAEWLRLLASELIMSSLAGWCATCRREMRNYESPCSGCGLEPVIFDDAFWIRIGARIKKAIRKDRQLLAVVKAEREDLYGAGRTPLFPHQLGWLGTLWKNAARPASRPFGPKRHYQLTNWLSGIPFPVGDVVNLITTDETIDSPHRLRKRNFKNYSRQFLQTLREGFLSLFGAQGVDQVEWWRTFKWVTRQRLEPLARLRGERPRVRKQKSSSVP